MRIWILSNKKLEEKEKTGTNARTSLIYKEFSKKHEVKYSTEWTDKLEAWCDLIYVIHFQSVYTYRNQWKETKKPLYYELHSFWAFEYYGNPDLLEHELNFINKAKKTFACSSQLKDYYIGQGVPDKKIDVTLVGFDIDNFEFIVLYTGNFKEWQGLKTLFKLAENLHQITFILAGTKEGVCLDLPNIEYVGYKTGKEFYRLLKMADRLIIPRDDIQTCQTMAAKFGDYMMFADVEYKILVTDVCDNSKYVKTIPKPFYDNLEHNLEYAYNRKIIKLRESNFNMENIAEKILEVLEK